MGGGFFLIWEEKVWEGVGSGGERESSIFNYSNEGIHEVIFVSRSSDIVRFQVKPSSLRFLSPSSVISTQSSRDIFSSLEP